MPTSPTPIAALPTPPSRDDSVNFATRGDAFLAALPTFRSETNAVATNVFNNATEVSTNATTVASNTTLAVNSANAAAGSAGASIWVSGTTYALGAVVWSPANGQIYRRIVAGAGTTDPSADSTNWTNVMAFTFSSGNAILANNLGIGTASPGYRLHVERPSYGVTGYFFANDGTRNPRLVIYGSSAGTTLQHTYSTGADALIFANGGAIGAGTEVGRFDSSGNLGLGVTPSAWTTSAGAKSMEVALAGLSYFGAGNTVSRVTHNAYFDGTNWKYVASSVGATRYDMTGANAGSTHSWHISAGGTAGTNITFTQAMTLDASGNLGVGTTSPETTLHLNKATAGGAGPYLMLDNSSSSTLNSSAGISFALDSGASFSGYSARIEAVNTNAGNGATALTFSTWNGAARQERGRFSADGNFYVNTTGAGGKVYVVSDLTANNGLRVDVPASFTANAIALVSATAAGAGWYFLTGESSGGSARIQIRGDGNVYNANGTYGTISDERLKQDIVDAGSQWDDLKAIRFRKYRMKSDVEADPNAPALFGVVAQELEQVCPGLVDDGEIKTVKSSILLMKAAKALQEAMARIESLEAKVAILEAA